MMSDKLLAITVGSLTAVAAALLLAGWDLSRTPRSETVAGAVCAFSSLTAALPGPPLVCVYSDMKPSMMRPTASLLILSVTSVGFLTLLATGNFGQRRVWAARVAHARRGCWAHREPLGSSTPGPAMVPAAGAHHCTHRWPGARRPAIIQLLDQALSWRVVVARHYLVGAHRLP